MRWWNGERRGKAREADYKSVANVTIGCIVFILAIAVPPASAQEAPSNPAVPRQRDGANEGILAVGRTTETGVGEVGQRQTSQDTMSTTWPMGRIDNRIRNRVQARIRNRMDRYYNPKANAASPFEVAAEQARRTKRPRSR